MAAPAVEAAPIAALVGASVLVICAWIALVGLSKGYEYTLGALLHTLADKLDFKVWRFAVHLGAPFAALDDQMRDAIGAGITQLEATMGRLFHGLEYLIRLQWDTLADFAHAVEQAYENLTAANVPAQVTHITRTIVKPVREHTQVTIARLHALEGTVYRGIDELGRDVQRAFEQAYRGIDDLRGRLAHDVVPAIRGLDHEVAELGRLAHDGIGERLSRLERLVLGSAIVGAALYTLTRYFPWFRCTNVRDASRALCRMDPYLLQALLDATLIVAGTVSLRELARELGGVTDEAAGAVRGFIREA